MSMRPLVLSHDPAREYFFREGCFITELANRADDEALSVACARVPAGTTTRWHRLTGIAERYVVLSGEGVVEIGDLPPEPLRRMDVAIIPPGCRQRITAIRPFTDQDGIGRCHLVLEPVVVPVEPRPRRPFQGWRYLQDKDVPADIASRDGDLGAMPEEMRRELAGLGLL